MSERLLECLDFIDDLDTDAALKRIEKTEKCDEQVKIVDEQARGGGNPAELTTEDTESTEDEVLQQVESEN